MTQESRQPLTETIIRVRKLAQQKLAQFSRLDAADSKEVYLFQEDQFCGVRFTLGAFQANWRTDQTALTIVRNGNQIAEIDLAETVIKRAA